MTPDRLLEHFDRLADAPDALPRLRRFILDLAVRGKLVEQDPNDEPACEMLRRIQAKRSRRTKPKQTTLQDELSEADEGEIATYGIPSTWTWASVSEVAECRLGKMLDQAKNRGMPRRYLRNINVRWFDFDLSDVLEMRFEDSELVEFSLKPGDVLICEGGEPGRAAVWDGREADIYFQKAIHRVRFDPTIVPGWFVRVLSLDANSDRLSAFFTGTGIKHFTGRGLARYSIPVPPLAEQHRIVARVDELTALCDRLEAAQAERESRRDRLVAASLYRLSEPSDDGENAQGHARFYLNRLPSLVTRSEHVKGLRQAILSLAVRGRLVPKDPSDEPASELLARCWTEKAGTGTPGKPVSEHPAPQFEGGVLPFAIASGWSWASLASLSRRIHYGFTASAKIAREGVRLLRITDIQNNVVDWLSVPGCEISMAETDRYRLVPGDILIARTGGTIGKTFLVTETPVTAVFASYLIRVQPSLPIVGETRETG